MQIDKIFSVKDKAVVVTGGASGLGLGYAEALACNGARVTLLDTDVARLTQETARLTGAGYDVTSEIVDIRDHAALDAAMNNAAKLYGRLDAVFANAGIAGGAAYLDGDGKRVDAGAIENYTDERWNGVIDVNLNGVFATLRAAARIMKPQRSGRIIVTTSLAAVRVAPHVASAYYASKAAAAQLARHAALELASYNICVNCIAPGWFVTNIAGGHAHDPARQAAAAARTPLHRVGLPSDMAGLAIFLTSEASSYVTGQQIVIDGGAHLGFAD